MTTSSRIKKTASSLLLLISSAAALGLYSADNLISLLALGAVFLAVGVLIFTGKAQPAVSPSPARKLCYVLTALYLGALGIYLFSLNHTRGGGYVHSIMDALSFTPKKEALLAGIILFIAGFYAFFVLSVFFVNMIVDVMDKFLPPQQASHKDNLRKNWFFVFSAMVFCVLMMPNMLEYFLGIPITFGLLIILSAKAPSMWSIIRRDSIGKKVITLLSALGTALAAREQFDYYIAMFGTDGLLKTTLDILSFALVFLSVFFLYIFLSVFYKKLAEVFRHIGVFKELRTGEIILYAGLFIATVGYIVFAFVQTDAFYGTEISNDIIYTSDSPILVKMNAFSIISHPENDLRQPLFSLFSVPFLGIVNLVGLFLPSCVEAVCLGAIQAGMILCATLMLADLMELTPLRRCCFMLLSCCSYTYLLFVLMLEQYAVAYFWLILCIYLICKNPRHSRFALFGTVSTLLTGAVLTLHYAVENSQSKKLSHILSCILDFVKDYVVLLILFCRFDVFISIFDKINSLTQFTGKEVTLISKLYQYTHFLRNCFLPPMAGEKTVAGHGAWRLLPMTSLSILGIAILVLALVGALLNRHKKSTRYALLWTVFSFVMLFVLGWGTNENGLILYALYFGWAFLTLIFGLAEKIEDKLRVRFLLPLLTAVACAGMLWMNLPAIYDMISFGIRNFPL